MNFCGISSEAIGRNSKSETYYQSQVIKHNEFRFIISQPSSKNDVGDFYENLKCNFDLSHNEKS